MIRPKRKPFRYRLEYEGGEVRLPLYRCKRCWYKWLGRRLYGKGDRPAYCPNCNDPHWNVPPIKRSPGKRWTRVQAKHGGEDPRPPGSRGEGPEVALTREQEAEELAARYIRTLKPAPPRNMTVLARGPIGIVPRLPQVPADASEATRQEATSAGAALYEALTRLRAAVNRRPRAARRRKGGRRTGK